MDPHSMAVYIIAMLILLVMSAYFSATETAFTSLNRIKIKNMAEDGDKRAERVLSLVSRFDKVLSTILIGNNIVNIANTAVATVFFVALYGSYGPTISTIAMTVVVLIFGEISPKNLAKENPERFAMFSAPIIMVLMTLFAPLNFIFSLWKSFLMSVFQSRSDSAITEDELKTMVEEAETEGSLHSDQSELIQNAIEFDELTAEDVLTPRVDIEAFELGTDEEEIAKLFVDTGYSRLPVYEEDLDSIIGVLNQKDFHNHIYGKEGDIKDYIKPVISVTESMNAAVLLKRMQMSKSQVAIVVDEYGGTTGLVTTEDIVEELVGEIYDEDEEIESDEIMEMHDGTFRVQASMNVEKMFDRFGDDDEESESTTVNGWVVRLIDKLPEIGDTFRYETRKRIYEGKVTAADDRKATEIRLSVTEIEPDDQEQSESTGDASEAKDTNETIN